MSCTYDLEPKASRAGPEQTPRLVRNPSLALRYSGLILNHMVQYSPRLDLTFSAVSDSTRRGILERLGRGVASITELADAFEMTLTGMKKHVQILEDARLLKS